MKITKFVSKEKFFDYVANNLKGNVALSGGNSPMELYRYLNTNLVNKCSFWLADERIIHRESDYSNWKNISTAMPNFELNEFSNLPESLDFCCLGFGDDGHFASIFEDFTNWKNPKKFVYTKAKAPYPVKNRISLSPLYIKSSKAIWVFLIGNKEHILNNFLNQEKLPNNFLYNLPNIEIICFFDKPSSK
jgi:6-phosphogluconolactonase/glucosamine-6-phosphate isomerase/deaminase